MDPALTSDLIAGWPPRWRGRRRRHSPVLARAARPRPPAAGRSRPPASPRLRVEAPRRTVETGRGGAEPRARGGRRAARPGAGERPPDDHPDRLPERPGAQVLPFPPRPCPSCSAAGQARADPGRAKKRDAAALARPGEDPRRLGRRASASLFTAEGDRSRAGRRDREGAAHRRHRRAHRQKLLEALRGSLGKTSSTIPRRSGRSCASAPPRSSAVERRRWIWAPPARSCCWSSGSTAAARPPPSASSPPSCAGRARRCCWPPATPSAPPPPSSWRSGASASACPVVRGKEGADPSSVIFEAIKRGQGRGPRRRHRRHRRPPAHQDQADGGAAEGAAGDRQGHGGRAARDLAGARLHQRPERHRPGEDVHGGDGGDRHRPDQAGRHRQGRRHPRHRRPAGCRCATSASARRWTICASSIPRSSSRRCSRAPEAPAARRVDRRGES